MDQGAKLHYQLDLGEMRCPVQSLSGGKHSTMCRLGSMIPLYKLVPRTIYRGIKNSTVHIQGHNRFPCIFTEETTQFLFFGSIFTQPDIFLAWYGIYWLFSYLFGSVNIMGDGEYFIPLYIYRGIKDSPVHVQGNSEGQGRRFRVWNQHFFNFMPSLWSEVQLTYILIMTVYFGIFRAIDIGLHSRDFHTAQSAHSA